MKRRPFVRSKNFEPSPKRRRNDAESAGSYQASRPGFIDQRLIEGSHLPQHSSSIHQTPSSVQTSESSSHGDVHLDAFDLELLAQQRSNSTSQFFAPEYSQSTPGQETYGGANHQDVQAQKSRFFESFSPTMPHHGLESSQTDPISAPSSSPLMLHQKKEYSWRSQGRLESGAGSQRQRSLPRLPNSPAVSQVNDCSPASGPSNQGKSPFGNLPLSVRGIVLIPVANLPERYRFMYPFPLFNAIQSKCFHAVYNTNDNIVLAAPTGSGKTVVMELAICRLLNVLKDERFKVIYQAPTKALCSERYRDWNSKFSALGLKCAELTGDTDHSQLRNIQTSQIITTTPEKWDSMTRKWKDHMRLMQLVKLFLIDEVHILKDTRGATLEAVVSRMKNIGSNVRFVALSATVPNSEDIATWLGKDATNQHASAHREHFGEDFRPVKLQKFVYGYQSTGNDFVFDKVCGSKLPEVIRTHTCHKPIMIFCCTRNSCVATAKDLAKLWNMTNPPARLWKGPGKRMEASNDDLKTTITAGVAFHHAGLSAADRYTVEKGFLEGQINVICCTSTLAVGVNLPCQLVIIKNTVGWQDGGCKEYSDLEMMQMLGRAGRPQFDDSATAVILTRKERVAHYERLVSGSESLESCLHSNLIEHLNAEIGLGNVTNIQSAIKWLAGTFLFVRLRRNPTHYKLKEGTSQEDEDELLRQICEKDIKLLQECDLVDKEKLSSTQFGDAMARYYIRFETMKKLLSLKPQADLPEILDAIVQAEEFHEIRLKPGEKTLYREINKDPGIRYPIKVDIARPCHKISLLLQSELVALDFPAGDHLQKHKFIFQQEKNLVFAHVNRLIRCLIDCMITREDSIGARNSLELARSFGAKVWDHSPLQMKQLEQIGVVAVRKLAAAGITDIEELEATEAHRIDMILSKNPPFGTKLLARLKEFPKLRVTMKIVATEAERGDVKVQFKIDVAFMNDKIPSFFQQKPVYVCCLTETSDGRLIDFRRVSASKLQDGVDATLIAHMKSPDQYIICHIMCDEIAGTCRRAEIRPDLAHHLFSKSQSGGNQPSATEALALKKARDISSKIPESPPSPHKAPDAFDGDDLRADDFMAGASETRKTQVTELSRMLFDDDWLSIDDDLSDAQGLPAPAQNPNIDWAVGMEHQDDADADDEPETARLPNGNWTCSHKCKDKKSCKHLCCREGVEKPRKPRKSRNRTASNHRAGNLNQTKLSAVMKKKNPLGNGGKGKEGTKQMSEPTEAGIAQDPSRSRHSTSLPQKRPYGQVDNGEKGKGKQLSFSSGSTKSNDQPKTVSSDFDDDSLDDLLSGSAVLQAVESSKTPAVTRGSRTGQEENLFGSTLLGRGQQEAKNQLNQLQPIKSSSFREIIELSDDSTSEQGKGIFSNTKPVESSAATAPLSASSAHVVHDPGRKLTCCCQDNEAGPVEQAKRLPLSDVLLPVLNKRRTITRLEPISSHSKSHTHRTPTNSSSGWDDPDRLSLEQLDRLINEY